MVCLENWFSCFLVLVLYSTVHHCIFIEPPKNEITVTDTVKRVDKDVKKTIVKDLKTKPGHLSRKKICENITPLLAGPDNRTTKGVPLCASQNDTATSLAPNSTVPTRFPQESGNGTKIITCKSILESPDLDKNEVCLNATNSNPNNTNSSDVQAVDLKANTTDQKPNANETNAQDTKEYQLNDAKANATKKETDTDTIEASTAATNMNVTGLSNITSDNSSKTDAIIQANATKIDPRKIDTEVPGLLDTKVPPPVNCQDQNQTDSLPISYNASQKVDKEIELIDDGQDTEDTLRNTSALEEKSSRPGVPLVQGQLAAILAGVFVAISVIAYVGLLSWRRYLESRYGNRQMLVNEDEFNDDLRHFSI